LNLDRKNSLKTLVYISFNPYNHKKNTPVWLTMKVVLAGGVSGTGVSINFITVGVLHEPI
jgi:hypothetical protein